MNGWGKLVALAYLVGAISSQTQDCADEALKQRCIKSDVRECSGRGACVCGACKCYPRRIYTNELYTGQYCQCDDYSCSHHNSQLCGGHGKCDCGECKCDEGYTGDACECPISKNSCIASTGQLCNDVGECECGVCRCNANYWGPTCEECPTCSPQCTVFKECVLCKVFLKDQYTQEQCDKYCKDAIIKDSKANNYENMCQLKDDDTGCRYNFTYAFNVARLKVMIAVVEKPDCPPSASASHTSTFLGLGMGVVAGMYIRRLI